jgi:peptide/nickel transport system permease protein
MAGFGVFLARRLLWALFLLVVASILVFAVFWLVPANPQAIRPASAITAPEAAAMTQQYLGLGEPIWQQYGTFVWRIVAHGSLGFSYFSRQSVVSILAADAPVTGSIVAGSAILWLAIAIPLGILAALRPRSAVDRGSTIFVLLGISAHPVFVGLVLSYLVGFRLGITPIQGYCDFFGASTASQCAGPERWASHLLLPWITFAVLFGALYMRMIRATVLDNMTEDYVRTARGKGASEPRVVLRHVLRNSVIPVVTILGMDLGLALGVSIFVEMVFGLPGLGREIVHAYQFDDYPVIVGVVLLGAALVIVFNLVVDVVYALLDPRVRLA